MLYYCVNKVARLRLFNVIQKKFQRNCFPVKFAKFLWTPILKNIYGRLLLYPHVMLFTMHEKYTAKDAWLGFFGKTVNNLLLPQKGSIIDIWQALNTEAVAQGYFIKKCFYKISENSQERNLYYSLLKKRLLHRCFPVKFEKFVRALFLQKTSDRSFCKYSSELLIHHFLAQRSKYSTK